MKKLEIFFYIKLYIIPIILHIFLSYYISIIPYNISPKSSTALFFIVHN